MRFEHQKVSKWRIPPSLFIENHSTRFSFLSQDFIEGIKVSDHLQTPKY